MPPSLRSSVWRRHDSTLYSGVANIFVLTPGDLVFVALNFLDVDCKANLRLKAYVDGVSMCTLLPSGRFKGWGGLTISNS